jgi:hypothetical protein
VKTLYRGVSAPGRHVVLWDGGDESGNPLASGVYFARLTGKGMAATIKMNLVR